MGGSPWRVVCGIWQKRRGAFWAEWGLLEESDSSEEGKPVEGAGPLGEGGRSTSRKLAVVHGAAG